MWRGKGRAWGEGQGTAQKLMWFCLPQGTSPAHWTRWKGSASHRKSGSCCPPCPLAAAPAPAAQHPACSSSSAVWPRVPVALLRLCACVMCPEWDPGDQPWPSTKCLKTGTGCVSTHVFTQGDLAPGSLCPMMPGTRAAAVVGTPSSCGAVAMKPRANSCLVGWPSPAAWREQRWQDCRWPHCPVRPHLCHGVSVPCV